MANAGRTCNTLFQRSAKVNRKNHILIMHAKQKYSLTLDNFSLSSQQLVPNYIVYPRARFFLSPSSSTTAPQTTKLTEINGSGNRYLYSCPGHQVTLSANSCSTYKFKINKLYVPSCFVDNVILALLNFLEAY